MIAARSAMMAGIGVPTGATDARVLRQSGAMVVLPDMGELHRLLRQRGVLPG